MQMSRDERQALVIENWKKVNCRGIIEACTGFGKTKIGLDAIERVQRKNPSVIVVVIVPSKQLKQQGTEKLKARNLSATVMVINTAAKRPFKCDFLLLSYIIIRYFQRKMK